MQNGQAPTFQARVPDDAREGQTIYALAPNGIQVAYQVLPGTLPGTIITLAIPQAPPQQNFIPTTKDEIDLGHLFYLVSKLDDCGVLPKSHGTNQEAIAGWAYFSSLTDCSGGMTLPAFQGQISKLTKALFANLDIPGHLYRKGVEFLSSSGLSAEEVNKKAAKVTEKIITKLVDNTPVFATAIFGLFGKRSY